MKRKSFSLMGLAAMLMLLFLTAGRGFDDSGLEKVRDVTEKYHRLSAAQKAGYDLVPGLDYCFDNPGVGGMGYHYINTAWMDTKVEVRKPEALVYAPKKNGRLELAAVEYIVPAAAWDAEGHSQPPMLFGEMFHLNTSLGVYALHAWIWKKNPAGIFADWNPRVSCP